MTIQPVEPSDFQNASALMEQAFARRSNQFEHAKAEISKYCDAKFNVRGKGTSANVNVATAAILSETLMLRLLSWAKFMRQYWALLVNRGLVRGRSVHRMVEDVAAYASLEDPVKGFDPENMLAEVDRRLGREHIPVTSEELEAIAEQLQKMAEGELP